MENLIHFTVSMFPMFSGLVIGIEQSANTIVNDQPFDPDCLFPFGFGLISLILTINFGHAKKENY